jgi:hypothetical protein
MYISLLPIEELGRKIAKKLSNSAIFGGILETEFAK